MHKLWKAFRYVALGGVVLQFGGCSWWWQNLLPSSVGTLAWEFLLDNNGVFDLFTDN